MPARGSRDGGSRREPCAHEAVRARAPGAAVDGSSILVLVWVRGAGFPAELALGSRPRIGRDRRANSLRSTRAAAPAACAELRDRLGAELPRRDRAAMAHIQELVRSGPMREALVWQNRRLVRGTVDAFLRRPPDRDDDRTGEYANVLATYVQRYCVRNDSIGFFGPVGWARWSDAAEAVVSRPAEQLVAQRTDSSSARRSTPWPSAWRPTRRCASTWRRAARRAFASTARCCATASAARPSCRPSSFA